MSGQGAPVCASVVLTDGGPGVRFAVATASGGEPAFVIRYRGQVYAYLNRCAHRLVELDWEPGQLFDAEGRHLVCATHGALYRPDTGDCVDGPCRGAGLVPLAVAERDGAVWLADATAVMVK